MALDSSSGSFLTLTVALENGVAEHLLAKSHRVSASMSHRVLLSQVDECQRFGGQNLSGMHAFQRLDSTYSQLQLE